MTNDLVMPNVIEVAGNRKINFAFSTVDKSDNVYNLLVCTFDAKWNNKCELYPITVLKELNWLQIDRAYSFDMAEGMCAHSMIISGEYMAFSCSKMFEDGSSRKVRVLSVSARSKNKPAVILEQSTPVDKHVMVSPNDGLRLIRYSNQESDVVYTVGSTVIAIKILADQSNVSWRTFINPLNTCHPTSQPLGLLHTGSLLIVIQDEYDYYGSMCSYAQVRSQETGFCEDLIRPSQFSVDGEIKLCDDDRPSQHRSAWSQHVKKVACNSNSEGSSGQPFLQVDEYQIKIQPVNITCGAELAKTIIDKKEEAFEAA